MKRRWDGRGRDKKGGGEKKRNGKENELSCGQLCVLFQSELTQQKRRKGKEWGEQEKSS